MNGPRLLAFGGAHMDRRGRVAEAHRRAASNPGHMREEIGGGAFNALRAATRRGLTGAIVSLRGGDAAGVAVAEAIEQSAIEDLSAVFLDRATPSYTAILERDGELVTGLADMDLYEIGFAKQIGRRKIRDAVASADALLCDANMPADAIAKLADMAGGTPFFAIAISPAKVTRLQGVLERLDGLFMNAREARTLAGMNDSTTTSSVVARLRARGLARGVVTGGGDACLTFDRAGVRTFVPPRARHVADVTGAGDALAGAAIAALMSGEPFDQAVREGLAAARLAVESGTASPSFTQAKFDEALALVGRPETVA